jgi:hypothetical protein
MSTKLKAGTSTSGAVLDADTTGILELQTGSTPTTAVTIDASQNTSIGTATNPVLINRLSDATGYGAISLNGTITSTGITGIFGRNSGGDIGALYTGGTQQIFQTGGTERMRITSGGDVGIGNTGSTSFKFNVTGTGTSSAAYAFRAEDSGTFNLFSARNDGFISTGTRALSPYNNTTGSSANMFVDSAGTLFRSTSSLKYKTDVQDATHGLTDVLKLRPVTYKGKSESDGDKIFGGLIAEEVDAVGLTEFVQYAEDGTPDALAYGNMVSLCIKAIQELNAKVDAQATTISELQARLPAENT